MNKPRIILPNNIPSNAPWIKGLCACLEMLNDLKLAYVEFGELPQIGNTVAYRMIPRWQQGTLMKVNDQYIYVDTWDYQRPLSVVFDIYNSYDRNPELGHCPLPDIKAVIKIQSNGKEWPNSRNIPVIPWTMFHTDQMDWLEKQPARANQYLMTEKKFRAGFSGREWIDRKAWIAQIRELEMVDLNTWPGRKRPGDWQDYVDRMCTWKCALVIGGKHDGWTEGKNRREVECAGLGIPMILNYKPTYLNPLIAGLHYWYADKPESLEGCIRHMQDPLMANCLAREAYYWWKANASQEGVCRTFIQAMEKIGIL